MPVTVRTLEEAIHFTVGLRYPLILKPLYSRNQESIVVLSERELGEKFAECLALSPVGEVEISEQVK